MNYTLPSEVMYSSVSSTAKIVYAYIRQNRDASYTEMAGDLGMTTRQAMKKVKELVSCNLIRVHSTIGERNSYEILP